MTDQIHHGQHQHLPQIVPGPPPYSSLDKIAKSRQARSTEKASQSTSSDRRQETPSHRSRSRSPLSSSNNPSKKHHTLSESDSDQDIHIDDPEQHSYITDRQQEFTFLLTNYDSKYQNIKQIFQQFLKYVPRSNITELKPTKNGIIIKSPDRNFALSIRNKHSFEIFGKSANITSLQDKRVKQPQPPRKLPSLSVVIRGVLPTISNEEIEAELREEGHSITRCIRIMCNAGPTYIVRVLTNSHDTINALLTHGAYIYRHKHRVEPSHSPPPLPVRCEKCQIYNSHPTNKCTNDPKCAFCTGQHVTKMCPNMQAPPKCNTCHEQHPTFSYKCKARPIPETSKPELVVPIRTHEATTQSNETITSIQQPISLDKLLAFITLTLQNIHPFQRQHVLHQIQLAARTVLQVSFTATYSGPYAHFHATAYETEV